ncbi:MAG: LPS assembly lipoprotein LptE [Corticimicrobacter sp.]|uniref:LPS-assembly lipoprotein LptE n=1 Tax=Corticimicrobacter sp. TaxID=2678536 RepID=UPI0032DBDC35
MSIKRILPLLALLLSLAACGFTMRGTTPLPFDTLYVGVPDNTLFGAQLRRAIRAASPGTRLVTEPNKADARLQQIQRSQAQREVSLDPNGRVEEYELSVFYIFRLTDKAGQPLIPDITLSASQDMPYSDEIVQAKEGEMTLLYRSLEESLIGRLINRLTAPDVKAAAQAAREAQD